MADPFSLRNAFSEVTVRVVGDSEQLQKTLAADKLALDALTKKVWEVHVGAADKLLQKSLTDLALRMDALNRKQLKITDASDVRNLLREHSLLLGIESTFDRLTSKSGVTEGGGGALSRFISGFTGSFKGFGQGKGTGLGGLLSSLKAGLPALFGTGAAGLGTAGTAGSLAASGVGVGGGIAAIAALIAGLPAIATLAAGGITAALGGAFTAVGVLEAAKNKKIAADWHGLTAAMSSGLQLVSKPLTGVLNVAISVAKSLLPAFLDPLGTFFREIKIPLEVFTTDFLAAFAQPQVAASVKIIGKAFGEMLTAFSPQLGPIVKTFADGMVTMVSALVNHPKLISQMAAILAFLLKLPGYILSALGYLTDFAAFLERTLPKAFFTLGFQTTKFSGGFAKTFDDLRHSVSATWDELWQSTIGTAIRFGHALYDSARTDLNLFLSGFKSVGGSVLSWVGHLASSILGIINKVFNFGSPSKTMFGLGRNIVLGLEHGIASREGALRARAQKMALAAIPAHFGALSGNAALAESFAASILPRGWSMADLVALWNRESGWNAWAVNPSSGAYGIPQSLGHGHPYNLGDYKAQIVWGLNYIAQRYGNSQAAWGHEMQFGWYDKGGYLPTGLSLAANMTGVPERVIAPGDGRARVELSINAASGPAAPFNKFLVNEMRRAVRDVGGGDVQVTFGTGY